MTILSKIFVYPIKALPGVQVNEVAITQGGSLCNDRRWAIADRKGRLINAKNNNRVFLLKPIFDLVLGEVSFIENTEQNQTYQLDDAEGLSNYFTAKLGQPVFLKEDKQQGFPDDTNASGPTMVSTASLKAVASWYPALSLDDVRARFRMNLEVSPAPTFWEDQLFHSEQAPKEVRIGRVKIHASNPCARCAVPMKNPESGEPYGEFYETFLSMREQTRPGWTDAACFDHWYRLGVNTRISRSETGLNMTVGDAVSIELPARD
ncbi:MAG: MOSC N-terminal beta barrel domain-containing protein [Cycloclasticus sp.]|nr:MOSC N-terminal beta barrel domain-containing protein [Cycloclasticus sp.]